MKLLFEKEYVYEDGKHLFLTESGTEYAERVYETHCTMREFLQTLGVSPSQAEEDACKMEHMVSEETLSAIRAFLKK